MTKTKTSKMDYGVAIQTKYLGPTDSRRSRIKAWTSNGQSLTILIDDNYNLPSYVLYKKAAVELCKKMDWSPDIIGGGTANGYTFVFTK